MTTTEEQAMTASGAAHEPKRAISETTFRFRVSPAIMETGIAFALVMGACGGLLPACNAARKEILDALRAV